MDHLVAMNVGETWQAQTKKQANIQVMSAQQEERALKHAQAPQEVRAIWQARTMEQAPQMVRATWQAQTKKQAKVQLISAQREHAMKQEQALQKERATWQAQTMEQALAWVHILVTQKTLAVKQ